MSVIRLPSPAIRKANFLLKQYSTWIFSLALLIIFPLIFKSSFALSLFSQVGIGIILALSYNMLFGQCGLLSFGHSVFFGLGGFVTIHAMKILVKGEIFFPVSLLPLIGGVGGLFFGVIFGFLSTRRPGVPFALITLGIGELVTALSLIFRPFFGGEEGISSNRVFGPKLLGISFGPQIEVYYLIAAWTFFCAILMYAFTRTPVGRMSNAVRDNPERAQFIGYNPHRVRWISFSVSSFFAGISGGLFAINYEIVNYDTLTLIQNSGIILMTYLGGIRQFWGPILGAIFYTFLWSGLSDYTKAWLLYLGIFFIIFVMFIPDGLAGLFNMHRPVLRARLLHKLIPAYARALFPGIFLAVGVIGLVEMSYNLSLAKEAKTGMKILGVNCDAATAWPWIISVGLASIGFYFFRRSFRSVTTVWDVVNKEAKARLVK